MTVTEEVERLKGMIDNVYPLFLEAQSAMLQARMVRDMAEDEHRRAEVAAQANSTGKNEVQRKYEAQLDPAAMDAAEELRLAEMAFSRAYAAYAEHKARIEQIQTYVKLLEIAK